MNFWSNLYLDLLAVRGTQQLNYFLFLLLGLYVLFTAIALHWGRLELIGKLQLKSGTHHNYGIEGIRGPLAFFVVVAHFLSVQNITLNGTFGRSSVDHERLASTAGLAVCYFFAITGYLFWSKFLRNPDSDVRAMFYGRIARIVPAFFAVCLLSIILVAISDPEAFMKPPEVLFHQLASLFTLGHYDAAFSPWFVLDIGPTWTLFWEFLFYAILPFLFAARRLIGPITFHLGLPILLHFWNPGYELLFI